MRLLNLFILSILLLLCLSACDRDKGKLPDKETAAAITQFAPIPSIQILYNSLDFTVIRAWEKSLGQAVYSADQDEPRKAYSVGVLLADLMLLGDLEKTSGFGVRFAKLLEMAEALRWESDSQDMQNAMQKLLREGDWEQIRQAVALMKQNYEAFTWDSQSYEIYSFLCLGQWVQSSLHSANLLSQGEDIPIPSTYLDKEVFGSLLQNLQLITTAQITGSIYFEAIYDEVASLSALRDQYADLSDPAFHASVIELCSNINNTLKQ